MDVETALNAVAVATTVLVGYPFVFGKAWYEGKPAHRRLATPERRGRIQRSILLAGAALWLGIGLVSGFFDGWVAALAAYMFLMALAMAGLTSVGLKIPPGGSRYAEWRIREGSSRLSPSGTSVVRLS